MILISAAEKEIVRQRCPDTHIVRTMIGHSERHRYYMTEDPAAMRVIRYLRKHGTGKRRRK